MKKRWKPVTPILGNAMKTKCLLLVVAIAFALCGPTLADDAEYLVGEGDVLKLMVYDHPDLATVVRVSGGGTIAFPLIGLVQVKNLTVDQIAQRVADKLSGDYIVRPQVSVFIEEFRSKKVTIIGQVERPGLYELSGSKNLMELISQAGGLTPDYGNMVTIHRKTGTEAKEEKTININLKDVLENGGAALDVPILDGDSVVVSKASTFYVTGEVRKPDAYKYEEGTTVIKAITMAGGFTNLAARGKVKVYREINGGEHVAEKVSMDMPILPEDVIVVPESFF
jgi:polysaccharide export outer membrane protein